MSDRVGIITYHRAVNYGAVLQTYALQTALDELGIESEIIDYRNPRLEKTHKKRTISECKKAKDFLRFLLFGRMFNKKLLNFRRFSEKHLRLSRPLYSKTELESVVDLYRMFIAGSDQIWNYRINDFDSVYFLDFVPDISKKKTYAASFGLSEIPSEYVDEYNRLVSGFESILIREATGAQILKKQFSIESKVVLDPTMLIPPTRWLDLVGDPNRRLGKYILVYGFGKSKQMEALAIRISRNTGMRVIWKGGKISLGSMRRFGSAGPCEFLSLVSQAEYIITNSFHGTALSIVFNRQFFTELLPALTCVNSRLDDILDLFGLQDRKFESADDVLLEHKIDYAKINTKLAEERRKSIELLKGVIHSDSQRVSGEDVE